ncbi:MAG: sulfite exporter TauE/SafE family protein [Actinomycetota bacterium]|nr:sulfite exporter TauE/SafE family protein [Actinomycetota bacterium]
MITAALIGLVAGVAAGLLGIGGGALFVPALVLVLDLPQVDAEATSLLAIIPVALVGTARQRRYGNVRLREGLLVGALAVPGAALGVVVVNAVPERAIEIAFAGLLLWVAAQLVRG